MAKSLECDIANYLCSCFINCKQPSMTSLKKYLNSQGHIITQDIKKYLMGVIFGYTHLMQFWEIDNIRSDDEKD